MKTWLRKNLALFLVLCMCISLCPVTVLAGSETVKVEAVTATAQPLDSATHDPVTLTTASVIPLDCGFYVKFDGLKFGEEYRILTQADSGNDNLYNYLYAYSNEPIVDSFYYGLPLGSNTITLTICDEDENPLYKPVTLTTQVVESVPATAEEVKAGAEPEEISVRDNYFTVYTYLPMGTLPESAELSFEVVKDGVVYAATTEDSYSEIYSTNQSDHRYVEIFNENAYFPLQVQVAYGSVHCGREMRSGSYDVRMYVDGKLHTTNKDAVICYSTPVVSVYYNNGAAGAYSVKKSEMAACVLRITNGDPGDFEVTMLKDDEEIGSSDGYRVLNSYSGGEILAVYYIPVEEPLEDRSYYFEITHKDGEDFVIDDDQISIYADKQAADDNLAQFGSYYYANFVLAGAGYDAGVKYKFELGLYGEVLAATYASPNNDGIFNVEFRDEEGRLIELQEDCEYEVSLYHEREEWADANWYFYNYNIRREEPLSLMSADTYTLNVTGANTYRVDGDQFYVWLRSDEESIAALSTSARNYKLAMTSVTGQKTVLSCASVTNKDERAQLYFDIPSSMEDAYYQPELLYKDKLVVNSEGVNVLKKNYPTESTSAPEANAIGSYIAEVCVNLGIDPMNLYGRDVTIDFYSLDNRTVEADHRVVLTERDDYQLSASMLSNLNPAAKYMTVMSVDGVPISCNGEFEYWSASEHFWNSDNQRYAEISVAEGMENYLEIVPCYTNYDAQEGIPYFSEVYVNVTSPEGKALQYITVNGEKICGNGFLVTEDCMVSAIFAEPETETYKATVRMGVYEYIYSDSGMSEAELEEILGNMTPEEREEFLANGGSGRVFKVLHSYELKLPPNTMQELDLTLPATLSNYKVGYIDVECADRNQWAGVSHNDAQTRWFLDMPECDVVVTVELERKQSSRVSAQYDRSMGTVSGLPTEYVMEGETVSFTAEPNEGNLLQEVYYEYYGYKDGSWGSHKIPLTPDENGVYSFVMPATYVYLYITFTTSGPYDVSAYAYGMGSITVSAPASEEGYMAGEVVTLTLTPDAGSRLVPKDGLSGGYMLGYYYQNLMFSKVNDTTYTFVMPHGDVSIEVRFEKAPAIAPGGTVVDNDTLIAALGGEANAALNTETSAVQLLQNVELQSPILFNPTQVTEFVLDLNGHRIVAVENNTEESGAIILHQNGLARLMLDSTKDDAVITTDGLPRNNFHLVWVRGGQLTLAPQEYICFYGAYSYHERSSAGIRVAGGVVNLMENFEVHGNGTGEALWASSGTTTVHGGSYFGGVDYYNQLAGELNLFGGVEDYDWVTSRSLGGSGIRVSGRAKVDLLDEDIWAKGGPNSAALHVDNGVAVDTPCEVNVYAGSYTGEYGKGLLVQSAAAKLTIHGGEFHKGYAYNADYSVDVRNCGVVADYLAPDRKVENLDRYLDYVNGKNIYEEMSKEDLQRSYLYDDIRVSDGPATLTNAELDKVLEDLPETITPEDITNIQNAVSEMKDLAAALEKDTPDNATGTTEKLAQVEALMGETTIEIKNEEFQVDGAEASITGAVINAGGDVTLNIGQAQVEEKEELPEECQNVQHFSLELTANGEEVELNTPVKVVLPVPAKVNPALLMILHYNEQTEEWETITPTVYQDGDLWYMTFVAGSFSDFAVAHKVSVLQDYDNGGVWVALDVHRNAAEDQQFLCAVYSEQGQMLSSAMISGDTFIKLENLYSAYELRVFATDADDSWAPKYHADTILFTNN